MMIILNFKWIRRRNAKLDPEATKVFENMKEYERQNLAVRIGKFTLPMQEDILGKKQAEAELSGLQKNEKDIGVDNEY